VRNIFSHQIWQIPHQHVDPSFAGKLEKNLISKLILRPALIMRDFG
jgi:hypothetical protein